MKTKLVLVLFFFSVHCFGQRNDNIWHLSLKCNYYLDFIIASSVYITLPSAYISEHVANIVGTSANIVHGLNYIRCTSANIVITLANVV